MILVDTSAWIEFLRGTGSPTHLELRLLIDEEAPLATTDVVVMELLAGAGDEGRLRELRRFLLRFTHLPTDGLADYEMAAGIYRRCREEGATIRSPFGCLVAAVALRTDTPVLALDRDYEAIARHTPLRPHPAE